MKYIDGIKETGGNRAINLIIRVFKDKRHIPITYYKPLDIIAEHYDKDIDRYTFGYDDLTNEDNLKWIDGQPYELIILKGKD
jgi:hypothetical protein